MKLTSLTTAIHDGLSPIDRGCHDLSSAMAAGKPNFMRYVQVPNALPNLAAGLRLAAVHVLIGAVIGGWGCASKGLGYLMFASLIVLARLTVIVPIAVEGWQRGLLDIPTQLN